MCVSSRLNAGPNAFADGVWPLLTEFFMFPKMIETQAKIQGILSKKLLATSYLLKFW